MRWPDTGRGESVPAALFPYRFVLDRTADLEFTTVGVGLQRWFGSELVGRRFHDLFEVARPVGADLTADDLESRLSEVFFMAHRETGRRLRGQVLLSEDGSDLLFVGSPVVTGAQTLTELGLGFDDFALHDATADIVVLSRFSSIQIKDLERQTEVLREALEVRDALSYRASTDPLTEVANRRAFWERSPQLLKSASPARPPVLVYIDIDAFKSINDDQGHQIGDEILRIMAARLTETTRESDLLARLGGDEFVLLFSDLRPDDREPVVERLRARLMEPTETHDGHVSLSISIGATVVGADQSLDEVIRDADTAMYRGRSTGRGKVTWFDTEMGNEREDRRLLTQHLRKALDDDEIHAVFQPLVDLKTGRLVGFEALARWHHRDRGLIPPARFVELAERDGIVDRLDFSVLDQALAAMSRWQEARSDLRVQVNLSGVSIDSRTPDRIARALCRFGVPPSSLTVEVTESWLIGDDQARVLDQVAELGVGLDLDDFGTGFSSMTHLQTLPIDGLKIDRSFVGRMLESNRDRRLVAATLSMARSLGLSVVAEGVETAEMADLLVELGCPLAQGYYFAKPLAAEDADALARDSERRLGEARTTPALLRAGRSTHDVGEVMAEAVEGVRRIEPPMNQL